MLRLFERQCCKFTVFCSFSKVTLFWAQHSGAKKGLGPHDLEPHELMTDQLLPLQ